MVITSQFVENASKMEQYKMASGRSAVKVADHVGEILNVKAIMFGEDNGRDVVAMLTEDGEVLASISNSLISDVSAIIAAFGCPVKIKICTGKSKRGREFIYAEPAE